ncbi:IS3 family transposase [Collinsella tanakaei]|uniref:IS3 family transposase n=1 Tax=Collinsella tanakaei TaxID=626935 RepID=UPI001F167115|nr:IS3 family transposase [Collinsella tanakaei]
MAANARRYPASAQRRIPGVPRSTYYRMLARPPRPKAPDPIEPDVLGAFEASRGGYGARRPKVALERSGIVASRRRICRIMRGNGLSSACSGRAPRGGDRPVRPPSAENVPARPFDGHAPRTHVAADLAYVRLLVDPCSREIVGCSCGRRKDARLVKAAFSNVAFPLTDIEVFHSDRGPEFCNGEVGAMLDAFGIRRSVSRPGNPYDNAVVESTNRVLRRELVRGRAFASEDRLRTELFDRVDWYDNCRLHSTLGYMTPAGFREAGLVLS